MAKDVECELQRLFHVDFRQKDALNRLENKLNKRVFSFETSRFPPGCRKFIAADLREFYVLFYRNCKLPLHFYEIIQEGVPCRLYFDLEYYKEFNLDINYLKILDDFFNICILSLKDLFAVSLNRENFIILDSSNNEKFSAHAILHMPNGELFPNNVEMKLIVKYICQQMLNSNVGLVNNDKADNIRFICDLTVYSKNRNFRLFMSSKCGKTSILKLADYCTFYNGLVPSKAQLFLDCLIIPKDYNNYNVLKIPKINIGVSLPQQKLPTIVSKEVEKLLRSSNQESKDTEIIELKSGLVPSPFPELDDHMLSVFQSLNPNARIRLWRIIILKSNKSRLVQYQLTNCRFCYNIQREHKSQNVYWSVNLDEFYYIQKCFDVIDCFKFSSQKFFIPQPIVLELSKRINKIYDKLIHQSAYTDSFYTSYYDRLFNDLLLSENDTQKSESEDSDIIILS